MSKNLGLRHKLAMTDRMRMQSTAMPGARLRLALLLLLCGLAGLAGVQPHGGNTDFGAQIVAQWEHSSQGIPSAKLNIRFGARGQSTDSDSPNPVGEYPFDLPWVSFQSTTAKADPVLAIASLPDTPRGRLRQPLKGSPQAPGAPPAI